MKRREQIEARYRDNLNRLPEYRDYIFYQWNKKVADLSFGKRGHIGREGCGAVAIHNVMKFIGREQNFCDVLRDMELLRMPWLGAKFGTKPLSLGRYFSRHKIPYWKYSAPVDFKAALLTHKIGIVCTWNRRFYGMHFYCVYYDPAENAYYSANFYTPGGVEFRPTELSDISNFRFIVGYIF